MPGPKTPVARHGVARVHNLMLCCLTYKHEFLMFPSLNSLSSHSTVYINLSTLQTGIGHLGEVETGIHGGERQKSWCSRTVTILPNCF